LLDKFYTQPQTAAACLAYLDAALPDLKADLYVEPSAGAGAFLSQMPEPRLGIDVEPAVIDILKHDFLEWLPPVGTGSVAVIGNPPFGARGAEAVHFFNHAAKFADIIALIMPASFMKASNQQRLDPCFHLVSELPLPDEPFLFEGRFRRVSTVFQIWCRRSYMRAKATKRVLTHPDFVFVRNLSEADFVMRRVGAHAGKIMSVPAEDVASKGYSPNSNFFISADGIEPELLRKRFQALQIDHIRRQSVAAYSVSKSDLVAAYEEAAMMVRDTICPEVNDRLGFGSLNAFASVRICQISKMRPHEADQSLRSCLLPA
jgi:predicted RNA methylase